MSGGIGKRYGSTAYRCLLKVDKELCDGGAAGELDGQGAAAQHTSCEHQDLGGKKVGDCKGSSTVGRRLLPSAQAGYKPIQAGRGQDTHGISGY